MRLGILRKVRRFTQRAQLYTLIKIGGIDVYQPIPGFEGIIAQRHYGTLERWRAIEEELGSFNGSALDIGCNTGFFTFQMARNGFLCIGIESERLPYYFCNLVKDVVEFDNAMFLRGVFGEELSGKLPTVDVTICLSVFHHMVCRFGAEVATRLMTQLMRKTRKVIFFETGQSNETVASWAKYLPPMKPNPKEWIENYFHSLGASRVKYLGEYETHLSPVKRCLFAVYTR